MTERISAEEFEAVRQNARMGRGGVPAQESVAVAKLNIGEALKTPCRWMHNKHKVCSGATTVGGYARRHGRTVRTTCRDGTLYVMRIV